MKKKNLFITGSVIVLIALFFVFKGNGASAFEVVSNFDQDITIYKSSSCGCCGLYANYFKGKGNSNTTVINLDDVSSIKNKYEVPPELQSCHTTIIGDYFIEGHVPLEAVEKLLNEKPDIKGIALPGMPTGSPGMPGTKTTFIILGVNHDGTVYEFMKI